MITQPAKVPQKEITSVDVPNFASGLYLNGAQAGPINAFIDCKDVMLDPAGFIVPRPTLVPFLPNTVDKVYQIYPVLGINNEMYYVTADAKTKGSTAGQMVYCQEGDATWTVAGAASGATNSVTVNNGGKPEFLRVLNTVLILNGGNGDKLAFMDLTTTPFAVRQETPIADPTTAPSATATTMTMATTSSTTNPFPIYYAYSYTTNTGETLLSPILTEYTSVTRDQWQIGTPSKMTITRPGTAPAGAKYWKLYCGINSTGGAISSDNMFVIADSLDLNQSTFIDDGSLALNLGNPAPTANSTDGPKVSHGIVEEGNPILFGDVDTPQNIWIGGGGQNALSFATALNGYLAQPNIGTNFRISTIIGFRNGQGVPSLTVLFNNTEGLAEQAVLAQQNVSYGNQNFTVWGTTSQHYGAAGVASPDSATNYNGKLVFMGTDGMMMMNTQPLRQNVISTDNLTIKTMGPYVAGIKNSAMPSIVGTAWDNKFMMTIPNDGFDTPQQILVMDDNQQVQVNDNNGAFYTYDIPAQWIGVVSPTNEAAFVYVVQGNKSFKLQTGSATYDNIGGVPTPFSCSARGTFAPMGGEGRNMWQADVQAMFYVLGLVGGITVGVTYRNQNGKYKTKSKYYPGPSFVPSKTGGWGDTQWTYGKFPAIPGFSHSSQIDTSLVAVEPSDVRIPIQIDDMMSEAQWWFQTDAGYNNFKIRCVSYEGINLGVRPDLQ